MNILIFSWRGPGHPHAGGAEESTHQHAKGWVKAGHKVTLFTSDYPKTNKEEIIDGVKIIRKGSQIFGVHWQAFRWFNLERSKEYDLVIDQFHGIPFFTPLYIRGKKLAFIHEVTKEVWSLNPWPWPLNLIPAFFGVLLEPFIFKLFYKKVPFMTVSQSTKKDLVEYGIPEKNISIIHNGLDVPKMKLKFPKEERTLLFLGALSKDKGIEEALKTFSILNNKITGLQFWIVGKGDAYYLKALKLKTQEFKIDKKVKFWGYVSKQKKYELLARAGILINPSIREGWGLVVIEAAAMGTPTVGYNVAGLRDSILNNKTGILCDSNSNACAEAVTSLIKDRKKYQNLRQNCIGWSKEFNWEKSSRASLKLIEKLVDI